MKFPWVSRDRWQHDIDVSMHLVDAAEERAANAVVRADKAEARYDSLVTRMLEMKREGFKTMPLLAEPLKPSESALSPQVEFEIEKASSGDPFLRRRLNVWAQAQAAMKKEDASIVHGIRYGDEPEEMENEA